MESGSIKKYLAYIGGLLFVLLILSTIGYFIYKNVVPIALPQQAVPGQGVNLSPAAVVFTGDAAPEKPFDFKGTLYLSLRKNPGLYDLGIYTYTINGVVGSKFTTLFAEQKRNDRNYSVNISPSVSTDGKKLVFARGNVTENVLQIFTSDVSGGNAVQITHTPDSYKREPLWNPSGTLIAYISRNEKSANDPMFEMPESWSTYLTDLKGNSVKIANGLNPIFSPDGKKLLVLQNDGLHAFDISVRTEPRQLGLIAPATGGKASQTMKIAVSADGGMLSWATETAGTVVVSRISSWDTFSMTPFLTIKTRAFWSAFSPDGRYLAVNEWRKDARDNQEYPVIMGYDLSNGTSDTIVTLISDDKSYLWLGSWK